jgi:hypothetical protein
VGPASAHWPGRIPPRSRAVRELNSASYLHLGARDPRAERIIDHLSVTETSAWRSRGRSGQACCLERLRVCRGDRRFRPSLLICGSNTVLQNMTCNRRASAQGSIPQANERAEALSIKSIQATEMHPSGGTTLARGFGPPQDGRWKTRGGSRPFPIPPPAAAAGVRSVPQSPRTIVWR